MGDRHGAHITTVINDRASVSAGKGAHPAPASTSTAAPRRDVAEGAKALSKEGAAIDFVRDAFGHLKAIAADKGGKALLKMANVAMDAGIVDSKDNDAFIAAAKTRQWEREKSVRALA